MRSASIARAHDALVASATLSLRPGIADKDEVSEAVPTTCPMRSATGAAEHRACAKRYALSSARSGQVTLRPATSQAY